MNIKDYYEILGITKDSSQEEIKRAYRERAKQTHPDQNLGKEEEFKLVNEAYHVLGNEERKILYDLGIPLQQDDSELTDCEIDLIVLIGHYVDSHIQDFKAEELDMHTIANDLSKQLMQATLEYNEKIEILSDRIILIDKIIGTIHFRGEESKFNLGEMALKQFRGQCEREIKNLREEIEKADKMLKLLYDYFVDNYFKVTDRRPDFKLPSPPDFILKLGEKKSLE